MEIVGIILGAISVFLGGFALWQARRYNDLSQKVEEDMESILEKIKVLSTKTVLFQRDLNEHLHHKRQLNLTKDKLLVKKTSKFNKKKIGDILEKVDEHMPEILKRQYIAAITEFLNSDREANEVEVTLRTSFSADEYDYIIDLDKLLKVDGISISLELGKTIISDFPPSDSQE